jgi:hypothetical protein
MTNIDIKDLSDDIVIKNIGSANWFRTMDHHPKTVGHMKLLISIVDRIGIFDNFDLAKTNSMEENKLNIIYAILRITNKMFSGYLDYVVKKIFRDGLMEIFTCTHLTCYDLFFDQLTQDIDHFVCLTIKKEYPLMNEKNIKNKFVEYLRYTFEKVFYQNMIKKLCYEIDDIFYKENDELFNSIALEFIVYTKDTLSETYETMKIFLYKIFGQECSTEMLDDIMLALKKHIDLKSLFKENCTEIDVYCEQKIDDEMEWFDYSFDKNQDFILSDDNNIKKIKKDTLYNKPKKYKKIHQDV